LCKKIKKHSNNHHFCLILLQHLLKSEKMA